MTISFYQTVLPPEGVYCALGIKNAVVVPTFHNSFEDLVARGTELHADNWNAYFALASFNNAEGGRGAINAKAGPWAFALTDLDWEGFSTPLSALAD